MVHTLTSWLIYASEHLRGFCSSLYDALAAVCTVVSHVLAPVLSPLLRVLNPITTKIGDVVYAALRPLPAWCGITLIAGITGIVLLLWFRKISNQDAITRSKDEMKAHLLALKLFKDDLRTVLLSQVRLFWAGVKLQRYVLTPVLLAMPVMLLMLAQLGVRYQWRPIHVGERVVLKVNVDAEKINPVTITLADAPGVNVEAGPVPGGDIVAWRLSGAKPGRHELAINVGDQKITKEIAVGDGLMRVSALRPGRDWTEQLLNPIESPLPAGGPVRSIEIVYPQLDSFVIGADWWVLYFLIISIGVALIFKPVFGVKF